MSDIKAMLVDGKLPSFTTVGGYPLLYLSARADCLCPDCATEALHDEDWPDDVPVNCGVNWESEHTTCDNCEAVIECAYPPDKFVVVHTMGDTYAADTLEEALEEAHVEPTCDSNYYNHCDVYRDIPASDAGAARLADISGIEPETIYVEDAS